MSTASKKPAPPPLLPPELCRAARALLGWSQEELAERAGLTQFTITMFENGTVKPRRKTSEALARTFAQAGITLIVESDQIGMMMPR